MRKCKQTIASYLQTEMIHSLCHLHPRLRRDNGFADIMSVVSEMPLLDFAGFRLQIFFFTPCMADALLLNKSMVNRKKSSFHFKINCRRVEERKNKRERKKKRLDKKREDK